MMIILLETAVLILITLFIILFLYACLQFLYGNVETTEFVAIALIALFGFLIIASLIDSFLDAAQPVTAGVI